MTDDIWRPEDNDSGRRRPGRLEAEMDAFDDSEFGGPLFGDTSENQVTPARRMSERSAESTRTGPSRPRADPGRLQLDEDGSGAMQHWTEDATGEVPAIAQPSTRPRRSRRLVDVHLDAPLDAQRSMSQHPASTKTGPSRPPADPVGYGSMRTAQVPCSTGPKMPQARCPRLLPQPSNPTPQTISTSGRRSPPTLRSGKKATQSIRRRVRCRPLLPTRRARSRGRTHRSSRWRQPSTCRPKSMTRPPSSTTSSHPHLANRHASPSGPIRRECHVGPSHNAAEAVRVNVRRAPAVRRPVPSGICPLPSPPAWRWPPCSWQRRCGAHSGP